jgi:hypothetical protein
VLEVDEIRVDKETMEMLASLSMADLPGGVDGEAAAQDARTVEEEARWAWVQRRRSEGEKGARGHGVAPTGGRRRSSIKYGRRRGA